MLASAVIAQHSQREAVGRGNDDRVATLALARSAAILDVIAGPVTSPAVSHRVIVLAREERRVAEHEGDALPPAQVGRDGELDRLAKPGSSSRGRTAAFWFSGRTPTDG